MPPSWMSPGSPGVFFIDVELYISPISGLDESLRQYICLGIQFSIPNVRFL